MQHSWSLNDIYLKDVWLTIGSFDGVHLGHQEVIHGLTAGAHANGVQAVVITFYPHPAVVLGKRKDPMYLTTPEERAALLGELGVDVVITYPFNTRVASLTAEQFMAQTKEHLGLRQLWVGQDFALGRGREGNVERLRQLGEVLGFELKVIPPAVENGVPISSSRIRSLLSQGDVVQAAHLLGRPYSLEGEVIQGDGRGRTIGIPTANLSIWEERIVPKNGVYVTRVHVDNQAWGSVTNIGFRPTFDNQNERPQVETHILDFYQDLYGQRVRIEFLLRLRDEQRFPSIDALIQQIHNDVVKARQALA